MTREERMKQAIADRLERLKALEKAPDFDFVKNGQLFLAIPDVSAKEWRVISSEEHRRLILQGDTWVCFATSDCSILGITGDGFEIFDQDESEENLWVEVDQSETVPFGLQVEAETPAPSVHKRNLPFL